MFHGDRCAERARPEVCMLMRLARTLAAQSAALRPRFTATLTVSRFLYRRPARYNVLSQRVARPSRSDFLRNAS